MNLKLCVRYVFLNIFLNVQWAFTYFKVLICKKIGFTFIFLCNNICQLKEYEALEITLFFSSFINQRIYSLRMVLFIFLVVFLFFTVRVNCQTNPRISAKNTFRITLASKSPHYSIEYDGFFLRANNSPTVPVQDLVYLKIRLHFL